MIEKNKRVFLFFLTFAILTIATILSSTHIIFASEVLTNWTPQTNLPLALASHQVVVYNNKIYTFGGGVSGSDKIYFSTIDGNGDLSDWSTAGNLPQALLYHQVLLKGNRIYLLGGSTPSIVSQNSVYTAVINNDGSVSGWTALNSLPEALSVGGATEFNNKIYYVGGGTQAGGSITRKSSVYYANLNADGTIGPWNLTASLPEPRVAFGISQIGSKIYLFGGTTNTEANSNSVLIGNISGDGTINSWNSSIPLPVGLHRPIVAKTNDYVFIMGGRSNVGFSNVTRYSNITGDLLGNWSDSLINLPTPNCCSPSVNYGNNIYIVGGHDGSSYFSSVYKNATIQLSVSTPTPTPTPTVEPTIAPTPSPTLSPTPVSHVLSVSDIKQYSSPWGGQIYDTATNWTSNPTVDRWGCALTSASMVLKYWGHNINPDQLNTWLKNQTDGYIGNGLLNWLAVTRYTKQHDTDTTPTLEYRRLPNTLENISNEVDNGRPSILKLPGHFVVGKGYADGESYYINDPATTQSALSYYGNSYLALNQFKPSHTDLSYILLTINPGYTLLVFDSNGNVVGESYFEEPLLDQVDGVSTSGSSLMTYMLPIPDDGSYRVEVTGPVGQYTLKSYVYNTTGDVDIQVFNGISGIYQKDLLQVNITGETSTTSRKVTIVDVLNDWNNAHSQGLIKNRIFYRSVKSLLLTAKKYINKKKFSQAKSTLILARNQINIFTPVFVDVKTSGVILSELDILIASL